MAIAARVVLALAVFGALLPQQVEAARNEKSIKKRIAPTPEIASFSESVQEEVAGGEIGDALEIMTDELRRQLALQENQLKDTRIALQRWETTKEEKQRELVEADKWYKIWNWPIWSDKIKNLKIQIKLAAQNIAQLRSSIIVIEGRIGTLSDDITKKSTAAERATEMEEQVQSLGRQIEDKRQLATREDEQATKEVSFARREGDEKAAIFSKMVTGISENIAKIREEYNELMETHTQTVCSEKEAKKERICERCSTGKAACGDTCITDGEECHFEAGCACNEGNSGGLIQLSQATHPLRERIAHAKAELVKIIRESESSMSNLEADIAVEERAKADTVQKRAEAVQEFDEAIAKLTASIEDARRAHAQIRADKEDTETQLMKVTEDGEVAQKMLAKQLTTNIQNLEKELASARTAHTNQVLSNKERIETLTSAHDIARNQLKEDIQGLEAAKAEAEKTLADIQLEHDLN